MQDVKYNKNEVYIEECLTIMIYNYSKIQSNKQQYLSAYFYKNIVIYKTATEISVNNLD